MEHTEEILVVTLVEKQKKNVHRYNIFLNGSFAFSVHEDMLVKYRILKDETIDRADLEHILLEDERHRAYLEAIRFIGRRPRSAKEVRLKLKQNGHEPELIDWVVERLGEQRYIDDGQVAKMWAEHRIYSQKKGRMWVKQELQQKGIAPEKVQEAVAGIDPEEEFRCAFEIAVKKWNLTSGDRIARRRKLAAFLMRRGYSAELVSRVMIQLGYEPLDEWPEDQNV